MRTDHGIRKVLDGESDKSHKRSLSARGRKRRIKVKYADGECTRMHKRSKWEIEGLEASHINVSGTRARKRTSMAPAARDSCQA